MDTMRGVPAMFSVALWAGCGRIGFDGLGAGGDGSLGDGGGGDGALGSLTETYIKASNTDSNDAFGVAVTLSGDGSTLVVGAYAESSNATGIGSDQANNLAMDAGGVYVFERTGATWAQQAYIKASNTNANDMFGSAVALSTDGMTLAVGAPQESSAAIGVNGNQNDNTASRAGAVYVFTRNGTTWSQQAYLKASNTDANDSFGGALALSDDGSTLAVGAVGESSASIGINGNQASNAAVNSGAVYVFTRVVATWSQQAYIKASNTDALDEFGLDVALSGDGSTLAVGAYGEASAATGVAGSQADNSKADAGAVYVFTRAGTTWSQQAYIKASNTDAGDGFGDHVALSKDGATLAVQARHEASRSTGINGDQSDNSTMNAGAVYVFTRGGAWIQQAYIKASNTGASDLFGDAIALAGDGSQLAVGAWGESSAATGVDGNQSDKSKSTAGAVYLFQRATAWAQVGYVKASNTDAGDWFGVALAVSADGTTLAVGATGEASDGKGVGADQTNNSAIAAGAVYVFR
jgi:HJR/Mrr/RecB family endonuclease